MERINNSNQYKTLLDFGWTEFARRRAEWVSKQAGDGGSQGGGVKAGDGESEGNGGEEGKKEGGGGPATMVMTDVGPQPVVVEREDFV